MDQYGLIGYPLGHSFSKKYFSEKFKREKIQAEYLNFEIESISNLKDLLQTHPQLQGLNVTIPYKKEILPFLNRIDSEAKKIGAVNTIKISREGSQIKLKGYNTDIIGFEDSLKNHLKPHHDKALILGTGGASLAVKFILDKLNIPFKFVSRGENPNAITYESLSAKAMKEHTLIINCTPLGTFPNVDEAPEIPYEELSDKHFLFDLVYNPAETLFMKLGKERGATVQNGLPMLEGQAEAAWDIWKKK